VSTQQIDWDQLYFANSKNLYTVHDANGIAGNNITGLRSKYIVEEVRNDPTRFGLNSVYSKEVDARNTVTGGIALQSQINKNFKTMDDLLGGEYWVDVDQFAEQDFANDSAAQSDLGTPNRIVKEGDDFGFNYDLTIQQASVFGQLEHKGSQWEAFAGLTLGTTTFWRTGHYQNGLFPDDSKGDGEKQSFFTYGIKGGLTYKINGRHYLTANAAYLTRPPGGAQCLPEPAHA
jgi:hypothetical protein